MAKTKTDVSDQTLIEIALEHYRSHLIKLVQESWSLVGKETAHSLEAKAERAGELAFEFKRGAVSLAQKEAK